MRPLLGSEIKRELRRTMKATLASLPLDVFRRAGEAIVPWVESFLPTGSVALFASREREIDTAPLDAFLRERGIPRAIPKMVGDRLSFRWVEGPIHELPRDQFGIPTPISDEDIPLTTFSMVLVPGLAFDSDGRRLGYGKGYYDRTLHASIPTIGLLLDEQRLPHVAVEPWDVLMDATCSPIGFLAHRR